MKTYIETKLVNAEAMTRAKAYAFRGWTLPTIKDGNDEGYLIDYTNAGQLNPLNFSGYVDWIPKSEFEATHLEIKELGTMLL